MISDRILRNKIDKFEKRIGYHFKRKELLINAISHPSCFTKESKDFSKNYEVMEFLGDAILGFLISEMVFKRHPMNTEGEMSKIKSQIVSRRYLSEEAKRLEIGKLILIGKGEEKTGGRKKESILAATMETIIAAIYLDGGIRAVRRFVRSTFAGRVAELILKLGRQELMKGDSKSALQEFLQKKKESLPHYVVVREEGPSHDKIFFVEIRLHGRSLSKGKGRSKKEAEQKAARKALMKLLPFSHTQHRKEKF